MNPLLNIMSKNNNNNMFGNFGNFMNMAKNFGNPQKMVEGMMQSNPQFQKFMKEIEGKDINQLFEAKCKEQGINPQDALNQVKNLFG